MKQSCLGEFVEFPAWLHQQMMARDLNQSALAELIGVRQSTISIWLSGKSVPGPDKLVLLARVFEYEASTVLQMFAGADAPYDMSPEMRGLVEVLDRKLEAIEDPKVKELAITRLKQDIAALTDMVESLSEFIESLPAKDG